MISLALAGRWGEACGAEENLGNLRQAGAALELPRFLVPTPELVCSNGLQNGKRRGPGKSD